MKVLNLQCGAEHDFEGWFASEDDFQTQLARGLVECPLCADKLVRKMPSAPRLNFGARAVESSVPAGRQPAAEEQAATPAPTSTPTPTPVQAVTGQAVMLNALRQLIAQTEDVGDRFADEARRMHYGEAPERGIRGQTSAEQALELAEEGIAVMPLPLPAALKETLQ